MTEKRCTDCKHTKGIGYDFWCGEGHTEYEVFGAETNCPYYEYHDWSKGTPSKTEKRFRHMKNRLGMQFIGYDEKYVLLGTFADAEGVKYIVDLLNQLNDENEQLKKDRFICLDCEHSGYVDIGCFCEYNDHWQDYINKCENFKEWQRND